MATEEEIRQFLSDNPPATEFAPYCYVSEAADALTVHFKQDADYSEKLNDHITVYRSLETNEIVGCRVKGISGILQDLHNYIMVRDKKGNIELALIFLAFRGGAEENVARTMNDLAREAAERNISLEMSA